MSNYPLVELLHGSRLYGIDGPGSDYDYKSIHLPDVDDCLMLQACKQSKTTVAGDQNTVKREYESFALQEFLRMASSGDAQALDLLHSEDRHIISMSPCGFWQGLRANRRQFHTKNMVSAVGFAKSMALKYGYRVERKMAFDKVLASIDAARAAGAIRLKDIWDDLPQGQHIEFGVEPTNRSDDKRFIEVAGKKMQPNQTLEYAHDIMKDSSDRYGARVQAAEEMDGNDMKALCHSFRVAYQLRHIYVSGDFNHPIPEAPFVKDIKYGKVHYKNDNLAVRLDTLITEVEELAVKSSLPVRVNQQYVRKVILDEYNQMGV